MWSTFFSESRDENENLVTDNNQLNLQLTALAQEKDKIVEGDFYSCIIEVFSTTFLLLAT